MPLVLLEGGMDNVARRAIIHDEPLLQPDLGPAREELLQQLTLAERTVSNYRFINRFLVVLFVVMIVICVGLGTLLTTLVRP